MTIGREGSGQIQLTEDMLQSAVRYALGRSTFIVYDTCTQVRAAWPTLTPRMRSLITRDVTDALTEAELTSRTLGMASDDREWRELLAWIRSTV